jgi:hypothetical protein
MRHASTCIWHLLRTCPSQPVWLTLLMQIMLGDGHDMPAMQFDKFEDGRQWYKDARAMAPELIKTLSGGWKQWLKLLATNKIWSATLFKIMPEVSLLPSHDCNPVEGLHFLGQGGGLPTARPTHSCQSLPRRARGQYRSRTGTIPWCATAVELSTPDRPMS